MKAELRTAMETVLRATCIFALPAGIGLSVLAGPIARLVYGDRPSTPVIAGALGIMGAAAIFAAVTTPLGSMLQAVGHMELPVILVLSGLAVKVVLNYVLAGIPALNILGGGISTLVCYVLVTAAEIAALVRITGIRFDFVSTVLSRSWRRPAAERRLLGVAGNGGAHRRLPAGRRTGRFAGALAAAALLLLRVVRPRSCAACAAGRGDRRAHRSGFIFQFIRQNAEKPAEIAALSQKKKKST